MIDKYHQSSTSVIKHAIFHSMFRSLQLNDLTWTFSISSTIHACASTQVADDLVVGLRRRSEQDSDARAMCLRESGGTEWTDGRKGIFLGNHLGV